MTPPAVQQSLQLAVEHHRANRLVEAEHIYREILAQHPREPDALHLLGVIAHQVGKSADACRLIERAIAINPGASHYHHSLGDALHALGQLDRAEASYRSAVRLDPRKPDACNALGYLLLRRQRLEEAAAMFRQSLALRADAVHVLHNLTTALLGKFDLDGAAEAAQRAIAIAPDGIGWNNLGNIRKAQGRLDEAIECLRRAVEIEPDHAGTHSNLLLAMNYHAGLEAQTIFDEHVRWAKAHAAKFYPASPSNPNDRSPHRPLRVGYVSPDLKQHPVGFYMEPVITNHRREQVEVFCYSDVRAADALTQRLERACGENWRAVAGWDDERVAQRVREDRIDILIDLAGHTAHNRLLVFARKPAPVQASYLGYVNTTGLATMDYAITDKYADPPGAHERYRAEKFIRLPRTFACYVPPMRCPEVGPSPAMANGRVTFACMNNFAKVTPQTLEAWAQILNRVPRSRLIVHADRAQHLAQVHEQLSRSGVEKGRVEFIGKRPLDQYYELHNSFDIALDPFPYNGGTTTCDALWMGVPVISLAGEHAVMRAGMSLLSTIGLPQLIAEDSVERYIDLAAELASDLPRLSELRRTLRQRMASSPLMDLPGFVRDLEQAYRTMWRKWCER